MSILFALDASSVGPLIDVLGADTERTDSLAGVVALLEGGRHDLVVVGADVDHVTAFELASGQRLLGSSVGVVLQSRTITSDLLREAMVAGVREVVATDDLVGLVDACARSQQLSLGLRAASTLEPGRAPGTLITVFSAKGGCGKTTMATNLASAAARSGKRVCLVDLDLAFGDVAITMQLRPVRTIADAVGLTALDATAVQSLVTTHESGVDAILAPVEPGTAESISGAMVGELLEVLTSTYDVVVVDSPPAFTDHVLAAFDRSDWFVLIATLDVPALKNLKLTLETMDVLGYPREQLQLVLNRSDAKVGLTMKDVERVLGTTIAVQVPSSRAVPAAINRGVPILLDQPNHPVSVAIRRLSEAMTGTTAAKHASATKRRFTMRLKAGATT